MFATRRPTSRIDVCDYNTILYRDYDANINFTKNYLLSQSPPPMTFRDLRSVMSNLTPSNVVILSEATNPSQIRTNKSPVARRKQSFRKKQKRQTIDVYRSLPRAESRCSVLGDRDITNDEMMLLANSFVIDHASPAPTSGFFHPQNLPNIQKQRVNTGKSQAGKSKSFSSPLVRTEPAGHPKPTIVDMQLKENINRTKSTPTKVAYSSSPTTRIEHVRYTQPSPPQVTHRTTPVDVQYDEDNSQTTVTTTTTTTTDSSALPGVQTRKQLHVYIPQIVSC